jgi:hypothetical protein
MSASIYGNVGGVSRKAKELYGNVGGVTRKLKSAYANVNGVVRKIFGNGVHLATQPYITYSTFGRDTKWELDSNNVCSIDFTGLFTDCHMKADYSNDESSEDYREPSIKFGVVIPLSFDGLESFGPRTVFRLNTAIKAEHSYKSPGSSNIYGTISDAFILGLDFKDGIPYVPKASMEDDSVSDSIFSLNAGNANFNTSGTYSAQRVYLSAAFEIPSMHISNHEKCLCGMKLSIPNGAVSIIDSDGTEYPVNFEK